MTQFPGDSPTKLFFLDLLDFLYQFQFLLTFETGKVPPLNLFCVEICSLKNWSKSVFFNRICDKEKIQKNMDFAGYFEREKTRFNTKTCGGAGGGGVIYVAVVASDGGCELGWQGDYHKVTT